jgi:hypothetical protein
MASARRDIRDEADRTDPIMPKTRASLGRVAMTLAVAGLVLAAAGAAQEAGGLIANRSTKTYHRASCELARKLPARSKIPLADAAAAAQGGYKPCATCKPDADAPPDAARPAPRGGPARRSGRPSRPTSGDDAMLRFSRDVAPILVGNCLGCHSGAEPKGALDLSTFEGLQKGGESGPVIAPGNPQESLLVQLVAARKMPRGGNRRLSDEAIEKIRRWVAEGARLDASDPTRPLAELAPSADELRREALAGLPADELTKKAEAAGRERIAKASPSSKPTATAGREFVVLGELPAARGERLLKALDRQRAGLIDLLGDAAAPALGGPEPIGVYVLKDRNAYTEFVRGVEQREPELGVLGHARLTVENPYVVAVDPLAGGDEPEAPRGRPARKRKADEDFPDGPERGLASIVAEALAAGTVHANANAPRWLADGLGALAAVQVEPGSAYAAKLRATAVQQLRLGGATRATEVLGDQGAPETIRALGYSLCDCLATTARPRFAPFVRGVAIGGGSRIDEVIRECFGPEATREQLLDIWGAHVADHYVGR